MYISISKTKKLLKDAGAARVSEPALLKLQKHIDKEAYNTAKKAVMFSKHAKRKTVSESDVKLAAE